MNGSVTYDGLILQGGINVDVNANLEELTAYENGVYNPSEGKDGFSKVTVDVPATVLDDITITENGHYTPPIGVDGYNDIVVTVPHPAPVLDDITITENGSYQPPTGVDGYDNITVNVPAPAPVLDDITITQNGTYTPPTGTDGYNEINVNVPLPANGIYKQTLTGQPSPIATFTGADAPIDELIVSIEAVQSGSGDPSPSNVRHISGWSEANVTVTDDLTSPTYTRTYTIPFKDGSDNPITVYGGGIDISGGSGQNNYGMVVYDGSENWIEHSSNRWFLASLPTNLNIDLKTQSISNMRIYQDVAGSVGNYFTFGSTGIYCNKTTADQTLADFKAELSTNNMQIKYPLQTSEAIQTQPTQVRTIQGNNNVSADCGEVTECKYYSETP